MIDGVLFSKPEKKLICYPTGIDAETYEIPNGTLAIGDYAFDLCSSLTAVTIPDSVTSIGDDAFCDCESLTAVTLPASVPDMDLDAVFGNAYALKHITFTVPRDSETAKLCKEAGVDYVY